jgi:hypothetical protein
MGGEQRVVENEIVYAFGSARDLPAVDGLDGTAETNLDRADLPCVIDPVQRAVRRGSNGGLPAEFCERDRKVAHDVADAADLAAGQGAVLGCEKKYGARVDRCVPSA